MGLREEASMTIGGAIIAQLRTTDLPASIRFYTETLGLELAFRYQDFYAGVRAGAQLFHLKHVDEADPSIAYVAAGEHFHLYLETGDAPGAAAALERKGVRLVKPVHDTAWGTWEFVVHDDQGHTLYIGEHL
jgi:catechol 2,3-dioxygenase-like lactoylglutathione lyase family enzyme